MPLPSLRLVALAPALLAQAYLFARIRQAILSSRRSDRVKWRAVGPAGAAIGLLFTLNAYILFRHIPWVDPPIAAQVGLFYPAAVWNFGSLFSALVLLLLRAAGGLRRVAVRLSRRRTDPAAASPADPGRRRFLKAGVGGVAAAPVFLSGYGAAHAAGAYVVQELDLPFGRSLQLVHPPTSMPAST